MSITQATFNNSNLDSITGYTQESEKKEDPLGRDAFLTMLVAQLKYQNPMDGTDFTAQLAQFSSLEQQFNTNDSLEGILASLNAKTEDNLLDFIGKEILSNAETITLNDGQAIGGYFSLESSANVMVSIYDSNGCEIRNLYAGQKGAGTHEIDWDGKDSSGNSVPEGTYSFSVTAMTDAGEYVPVETTVSGKVTGITREDGISYLMMGERRVDPDTVVKVWQPEENSQGTV